MARNSIIPALVLLMIAGQAAPVEAAGPDCHVTLTEGEDGTATLDATLLPSAPLTGRYTFSARISHGSNVSASSQAGKLSSENITLGNSTFLARIKIATGAAPTIEAVLKIFSLNGDLVCEDHFSQ